MIGMTLMMNHGGRTKRMKAGTVRTMMMIPGMNAMRMKRPGTMNHQRNKVDKMLRPMRSRPRTTQVVLESTMARAARTTTRRAASIAAQNGTW